MNEVERKANFERKKETITLPNKNIEPQKQKIKNKIIRKIPETPDG
jgi:hypothetical protein